MLGNGVLFCCRRGPRNGHVIIAEFDVIAELLCNGCCDPAECRPIVFAPVYVIRFMSGVERRAEGELQAVHGLLKPCRHGAGVVYQQVQVLVPGDTLVVHAGKRHLNLKFAELEHYQGERGRRGNKLPRGFQKVDSLAIAE